MICITLATPTIGAGAGVSRETKRELTSLKKDLGQISRVIKRKDFEEARELLIEVDTALKALIQSSQVKESYSAVKKLNKTIKKREKDILKRDPDGGPVFKTKTRMKEEGGFGSKDIRKGIGKISFTNDIAPFMVNLCLRCHNNRKKESEFSIETFKTLMQGGDNGAAIVPGNLDESYLWSLVGKQDPIKMPQGQARITRTNWNNLRSWILEGAKFDGPNANAKLRDLAPSAKELNAKKLRKLSDEEFKKLREEKTRGYWKQFAADEKPNELITDELLLIGNVEDSRLQEYEKHLQEGIQLTRQIFKIEQKPLFRGRLAVFVIKDRFSFDEFHLMVAKKEVPKEIATSFKLSSSHEDAWIVFYDNSTAIGNRNGSDLPFSLKLTSQIVETFLSIENSKMPYWIRKGTGLAALSFQKRYGKELKQLQKKSIVILKERFPKPNELFNAKTFVNSELDPVSLSLVRYFIQSKGDKRYLMLVKEIHNGESQPAAFKKVYGQSPQDLGKMFYQSLR